LHAAGGASAIASRGGRLLGAHRRQFDDSGDNRDGEPVSCGIQEEFRRTGTISQDMLNRARRVSARARRSCSQDIVSERAFGAALKTKKKTFCHLRRAAGGWRVLNCHFTYTGCFRGVTNLQ